MREQEKLDRIEELENELNSLKSIESNDERYTLISKLQGVYHNQLDGFRAIFAFSNALCSNSDEVLETLIEDVSDNFVEYFVEETLIPHRKLLFELIDTKTASFLYKEETNLGHINDVLTSEYKEQYLGMLLKLENETYTQNVLIGYAQKYDGVIEYIDFKYCFRNKIITVENFDLMCSKSNVGFLTKLFEDKNNIFSLFRYNDTYLVILFMVSSDLYKTVIGRDVVKDYIAEMLCSIDERFDIIDDNTFEFCKLFTKEELFDITYNK